MPAATATVTASTQPEIHTIPLVPPISGWTNIGGYEVNPSVMALVSVGLLVAFFLWRAQRNRDVNSFDISDLVMDDIVPTELRPGRYRKASNIKMLFLSSFGLSSWVLVDQAIKLSPQLVAIYTVYMATWCAAAIAKVIFDKKDAPSINFGGTKP